MSKKEINTDSTETPNRVYNGLGVVILNEVKFGRWILKYCKEMRDAGIIYWQYENKDYDTEELYQVFLQESTDINEPKYAYHMEIDNMLYAVTADNIADACEKAENIGKNYVFVHTTSMQLV